MKKSETSESEGLGATEGVEEQVLRLKSEGLGATEGVEEQVLRLRRKNTPIFWHSILLLRVRDRQFTIFTVLQAVGFTKQQVRLRVRLIQLYRIYITEADLFTFTLWA